jgi:hypothetical protein
MVTRKSKPQTGKSTGLLNRDGLPAPGRSLRLRMKQLHSRRNRGRDDRALAWPLHKLSQFRHPPGTHNREPNSALDYRSLGKQACRLPSAHIRSNRGHKSSGNRKIQKHLPTMGTLLRICPRFVREPRPGPIDREPPWSLQWARVEASFHLPESRLGRGHRVLPDMGS